MNVKLLRRIQKTILRRYKQLEMENWFKLVPDAGACGTTACIAGWAVTLHNEKKTKLMPLKAATLIDKKFGKHNNYGGDFQTKEDECTFMERRGGRLLGITQDQAEILFYAYKWPAQFALRGFTPGTKKYAKTVSDRIGHFIQTNGNE